MKTRRLGRLEVSAIGLGCMGMTGLYGARDAEESKATIRHAVDRGITLIDTSDAYGNGKNETMIGEALKGLRSKVVLATKFGNLRNPDGSTGVNGRPDYVPKACDASLKRLGTDHIDLYFVHRIDPDVPIEETVGAMAKLVEAGKIGHIGLSEAGVATIRRAHAEHPVAALQTEYSLWTRDVEDEILPACRELGIGFNAYAPLGRGFLTGRIDGPGSLEENDRRRDMPRFQDENLEQNLDLLKTLEAVAEETGHTPAQVALAWTLAMGEDIVPIPGASRRKWIDANVEAAEIALPAAALARLDGDFVAARVHGTRYPGGQMKRLGI
ncbi:aldo/keto reductase [Propylenella binzhouense]|uniref:Aldo/keto reductase n=1 Tax=Propylenella binzhouense TaxID=2555902 RepID=A0A964WV58_9HYPH|nr:aldo/keto reductase [Propylenella binzhouense]MYZ49714.1 aldo/keto reductase [Propylenella binzhouense]